MKEVKFYEAFDGTLFSTPEKCTEYENNSTETLKAAFEKLIVRTAPGHQITKWGDAFPIAPIDENWWYAIIVMKNETDYETVKKWAKRCETSSASLEKIQPIYNKEVLLSLGECAQNDDGTMNYEQCYWCCTVDKAIEDYKNALLTFNAEKS